MSGKSKKNVVIIYAVLAIMYAVIFLAVPFEKNATTWIAFSFGCLSIIAGAVVSFMSFDKGESLKSKVYGFPMFRLGYYYTTVQVILTLALFIAEFFVDIPSWISIVFGVLLLGVFIIGVVAIDNVRDVVESQDVSTVFNTQVMESLKIDVESLVSRCSDASEKKEIEKLVEEIRFSDPVSNERTQMIEERIIQKINDLSTRISEGNTTDDIKEIRNLLRNRNDICKQSK